MPHVPLDLLTEFFNVLNLVYFSLSLPFLFILFYFFQGIILDGGGLERKE